MDSKNELGISKNCFHFLPNSCANFKFGVLNYNLCKCKFLYILLIQERRFLFAKTENHLADYAKLFFVKSNNLN